MLYDKRNTDLSTVSAIILAGGRGTRISEYTKIIPKPMIKINGKPIITYIIDHYAKFGVKNFYITFHEVNEKIDDGSIRGQFKINISKNDKLIDLYHKAFKHFPYLLNKTIKNSKKLENNIKFGSYFSYPSLFQLILFRLREIFN